jgi:hypothetical protein
MKKIGQVVCSHWLRFPHISPLLQAERESEFICNQQVTEEGETERRAREFC